MICAGIDAGSRTIKAVVVDTSTGAILASGIQPQGVKQSALAGQLFESVMAEGAITRSDLACIVATGYGRNMIAIADETITEITCHAAGVRSVAPEARTVVDIGGQDSKLLRLDPNGQVRDFVVNDRCAAGTGRFLELAAARLELGLDELGANADRAESAARISSMCAVFAETEIVGLLAAGVARENIVAGVQTAIASRIGSMAGRSPEEPVVFTGGVALVSGMARALAAALGCPVHVAPVPQLTGALGAAILGARQHLFSRFQV